jgi:hypothetical protein
LKGKLGSPRERQGIVPSPSYPGPIARPTGATHPRETVNGASATNPDTRSTLLDCSLVVHATSLLPSPLLQQFLQKAIGFGLLPHQFCHVVH